MKHLNFLSKTRWLLVPLMLITLGIGQMWATDVSITSFTALSGSIDSNISYSSAKGNGTNDPILSSNWLRIYKPASGKSDGGYITVTAADGYEITSITFTNANDKATAYKYSVDGGSLSSSTSIAKSGTFTYNTTTFSTINFYNSGSDRLSVASIAVTYQATGGGGGGSNNPTLSSIAVATAPTKTTYTEGENFDPTGLVITRNYSSGPSDTYTYANHTSEFSFTPSTSTALTTSNTSVTITYGGKSTSQAITVNASGGGGGSGSGDDGTLVITRSCFPSGSLTYNVTDAWSATASTGETVSGQGDLYSTAAQETMQTKNSSVSTHYHNTTALPGALKGISVDVASGTDRTYTVYASASAAITSISGLTSIGTVTGASALTNIDTSKGYKYFWMNCGGGASYLNNITITYVAPEESECTKDPTVSFATVSPEAITAGDTYTNLASVQYNSSATGQTITYASSDPTIASVDASTGEVTANKAGSVTITATAAESGDYCEASETYSLTINAAPDSQTSKTINLTIDETSVKSADEIAWSGTYVSVSAVKGTTAANNYCPPSQNSTRFYKNSILTFTPVAGYKIDNIVFTAKSDDYATALANSTWTNATAVASSTTVTVTASGSGAVSATIGATCGFSQIIINYHQLASYAVTVTNPAHGTITVKDGGSNIGATVQEGKTLTVTGESNSPAYAFGTISAYKTGEPGTTVTITNDELTMPAYPITITATETALFAVNLTIVAKDKNDNELSGAQGNVATIDGGEGPVYKANNGTITLAKTPASGYEFIGWSATSGITINGSTATVTAAGTITATFKEIADPVVTASPDPLTFAPVAKKDAVPAAQEMTITGQNLTADLAIASSEPSLFAVSLKSGSSLTPDANKAVSATIIVTPQSGITNDAGVKTAKVIISGGGLTTNKEVTVSLTVQETYTVNWYVNSDEPAHSQTAVAGTSLTGIPTVTPSGAACDDYTFAGWKEGAIATSQSTAPTYVNLENIVMPEGGADYYAVFVEEGEAGTETKTDELTLTLFGISGTSYTDFSNKTVTTSQAVYAGKCAGGNSAIQLRKDATAQKPASGVITTTSGGKAKKVTVTWNTNTSDDNDIEVFGKNTAYSSPADLVDNNAKGTSLGTIVKGTSTELTISGDYEYIGFRATAGAVYLDKVEIDWEVEGEPSYNYVTTCVACSKVTLQKVIAGEGAEAAGNAIAFSPASTTVKTCEAAEVTVNPTIATGWELTSVVPTGVTGVTYNAGVISIPQGKEGTLTVTATFSQKNYSIAVETYPAEIGAQLGGATSTAKYGVEQTISTDEPAGYIFGGWYMFDASTFDPENTDWEEADLSSELFTGDYDGEDLELEAKFLMPEKNLIAMAYFDRLYTVTEALALVPNPGNNTDYVYVEGLISHVDASSYTEQFKNLNYYISIDGSRNNELLVYHGYKGKNQETFSSADDIKVGDKVIVYGKLTNYSGTKEFAQSNKDEVYSYIYRYTEATLSSVEISGDPVKTDYFANENFTHTGLTATAIYSNTGYSVDVTNTATWKYNNADSYTVTENATVNVTASWGGKTSDEYPVSITATTKTLEYIELSETSFTGYLGQALPKPTTVTAHFDDNGVKSTENVTAFARVDEDNEYGATSTAEQTITVKYSFGLVVDASATYTVTLSSIRNTQETAYSVAKGRQIIDLDNQEGNDLDLDDANNKVFVLGRITAISGNTYTIKDNAEDDEFIEIYNGSAGSYSVAVGDLIKVEGNLYYYENNSHTVFKYQIMNGEIVWKQPKVGITIADKDELEVGQSWTIEATIDPVDAPVTYSIKNDGSNAFVSLDVNEITAIAPGTATIIAHADAYNEYLPNEKEFTVTVVPAKVHGSITYVENGANEDLDDSADATALPDPLPTVTKDGNVFAGWFTDAEFTILAVAGSEMPSTDGVTLYAKWIEVPSFDNDEYEWQLVTSDAQLAAGRFYVLGYNKTTTATYESGNYMTATATTFATEEDVITAANRTSAGSTIFALEGNSSAWTFRGMNAKLLGGTTGNNMVWDQNTAWTIAIANNGNATITNKTANVGSLQYNSSSPRYKVYTSDQAKPQLYVWAKIPYKLTYDATEGSNAPAVQSANEQGEVTITSDLPTAPEGYVFNGWKDSENHFYYAGQTITLTADMTLSAQWRDGSIELIAPKGGKFIINQYGDTAVFSRGNLQYQQSTNTWRCAENQYEWMGNNNLQMGNPEYAGWVDLFSWSIGAENNYGATSAYDTALYENKAFVDWGNLFPGSEEEWSTLSIDEWYYMLYTRANANNLWGMAMIGDNLGMILLPEGWTALSGVTFVPGTIPTTDMWNNDDCLDPTHADEDHWRINPDNLPANKFTQDEWAQLEAAGAVFMPYAGRRSGGYGNHTNRYNQTVDYEYAYSYYENYYGAYWTSKVAKAEEGKAYWLPMICGGCDANHENWGRGSHGWWENGRYGHSVRLVHIIPRQYSVTYDANGATIGSVPTDGSKYLKGAGVTLADKGNLKKKGYTFAGWKFKNQIYQAGETYTISGVKYNEEIVFVAQWEALPVWATTYTSNLTTSAPDSKVIPEDAVEYDAWKIAKGSSISLTVPAGTTVLHFHLVAWNGEAANVTINGACFNESKVIDAVANTGIANNSPFTLEGEGVLGCDFYYSLTPDNAITENTVITFTTSGGKRAVVFGVNAIYPEITLDPALYDFANVRADQQKQQVFTITANEVVSGALSATLLNNESGKFSVSAIEDNKVTVTFAPDGASSGDFSAQLKISASNASVTADLTGTAIAADAPEIVVNKNAVAFGRVNPNAEVSDAIAVQLLNVAAVNADLSGDDAAKFGLSANELTESGDLVITPNTTENGVFSATLTLSATDAEDVVIPLSITVATKWAVTYTSNVAISSDDNAKKVTINGVDYNSAKSNKASTATITLPKNTEIVHLHIVAWKDEAHTVTVSGECFNENKELTITANENVSGSGTKYDLGNNAIAYYFTLTPDNEVGANEVITLTAATNKRFVLFGVNEEGGIHELPAGTTDASNIPSEINLLVGEGKTLEVTEEKELNNLTVEAGGTVSGDEKLTVNNLIIKTTLSTITSADQDDDMPSLSGQIALSNDDIEAQGDVFIEITLTQLAVTSGWYAFSVPFPVSAANGIYYGNTQLTRETQYAIMAYHEELRAAGQYAWKKYYDIMRPGQLYIIAVGDTDYKTLLFKKEANADIVASNSVAVSNTDASGQGQSGWNGLGNPNQQIAQMDGDLQFLDHENNCFHVRLGSETSLSVGSAFMYQYTGSEESIVIEAGTVSGALLAPAREPQAIEKATFRVKLINEATGKAEDIVYLRTSEEATNTYEIGRDLGKMSMGTAKCAQMSIPAYGTQLCIADFPLVNNQVTYPLNINTPKAGTYSLFAPNAADADIYLTREGAIIWNLSESAYTIDLNKGVNTGYGLLLKAKMPQTPTGIENGGMLNGANGVQKVIIDENVFILRGGQMYDVTGKMVK